MKQLKNMTQVELAAYIQDASQNQDIHVVLSGGSAVSFYSSNRYVSNDLDLINTNFVIRIISATDCVKDRLCAFYFWNDQQGLAQAVLVTQSQTIDLKEIKRWSKAENKEKEYEIFEARLKQTP